MADIVISLDYGQASLLLIGSGLSGWAIARAVGKWVIDRTSAKVDAYNTEKMKNLATHEDIAMAVENITSMEWAKADVAGRFWNSQQMWTSKRDTYIRLTGVLSDIKTNMLTRIECVKVIQDDTALDEQRQAMRAAFAKADESVPEITTRFSREAMTAVMFVSADAVKALAMQLPPIDWNSRNYLEPATRNIALLDNAARQLLTAAVKDLGYETKGRVQAIEVFSQRAKPPIPA